jgi:hypothetical protein
VRTTDAVCLLRDTLAAVRLLRFETTADAGYVTTLIEKLIALDLPPPLAELTTRELLLCDLLLRWVLADAVTGASSVPSAAAEDFPPAPTQSEAAPTAADSPAAETPRAAVVSRDDVRLLRKLWAALEASLVIVTPLSTLGKLHCVESAYEQARPALAQIVDWLEDSLGVEDFAPAPTQSEAAPTAADPPAAASGKETDEELSEEFVRGLPGPLQLMVAVERANSKREQRTGEPPVFELPARLLRDETTTDSLEDAE